jgi:hypothetical protein
VRLASWKSNLGRQVALQNAWLASYMGSANIAGDTNQLPNGWSSMDAMWLVMINGGMERLADRYQRSKACSTI